MGTLIIAVSIMVVGIILYLAFKPRSDVSFTESHDEVQKSPVSIEKASITEKPVVKRAYKKREISERRETESKKG